MLQLHESSNEGSIDMIRAKYVFVQGDRLCAVYAASVKPSMLRDVALQLATLPGVEAGADRVSLGTPTAPPLTMLWMRVLPGFSADEAQKLFRRLTQPEWAIAIARLGIQFKLCRCGQTSITVSGPVFLPEFEPEDIESFDLRLYAALKQLDAWSLVEAQPHAPYNPLTLALEKLLAGLGAYVTNLYIEPHYSPNQPCPHGGS